MGFLEDSLRLWGGSILYSVISHIFLAISRSEFLFFPTPPTTTHGCQGRFFLRVFGPNWGHCFLKSWPDCVPKHQRSGTEKGISTKLIPKTNIRNNQQNTASLRRVFFSCFFFLSENCFKWWLILRWLFLGQKRSSESSRTKKTTVARHFESSYEIFIIPKSWLSGSFHQLGGGFNPLENMSKWGLFQVKGKIQQLFKITRKKLGMKTNHCSPFSSSSGKMPQGKIVETWGGKSASEIQLL